MKQLKFYILLGILVFSGRVFSQSLKTKDLIGRWTLTLDTTISNTIKKWYFKNDTLLIATDSTNPYFNRNMRYDIHKSHKTTILKTHWFSKNGVSNYIIYAVKKVDLNHYNLKILEQKSNRADGNWETIKGYPFIFYLKRVE